MNTCKNTNPSARARISATPRPNRLARGVALGLCATALLSLTACDCGKPAIQPVDVPNIGFGYPGNRDEIQDWADKWEIGKITRNSWDLWAGMTAGSGQRFDGAELPIWETWCGTNEVFDKKCAGLTRPARGFVNASQLSHNAPRPDSGGLRIVAFNKFNPPMAKYIDTQHAGPGGGKYDYTLKKSLMSLNAAWPSDTPIAERKVQEAPYTPGENTGIEIKPVMFAVKAKQLTSIPLWRGPQDSSLAGTTCQGVVNNLSPNASKCHPDPNTWKTCVILDPEKTDRHAGTVPVNATPEQIAKAEKSQTPACANFLYAPLNIIYHSKMNAAEAESYNKVGAPFGALKTEAGDFTVLTAMHINTKAIVNWVWQTMWWQPGEDTPNNYPGNKQGMTDKVKHEWRNYAMCTAYNQTQGAGSPNIQVCFNPFLETSASIPDGLQSNCMSCHGTATAGQDAKGKFSSLHYPDDYLRPIDFNNDPRFKDYTRTDFSWAIPSNAR